MRRVVVVEYVSLDGVVQAPGHSGEDSEGGFAHGGWTGPFMDDHRRFLSEEFQAAGAVVLGRVTYEIFAAYWPTVTDEEDEIARALNSLPKYVASTTLNRAEWDGTVVIKSNVAEEVGRLKELPGKDILVVGSSGLAQTLMQHDLVDEYRLWLHPVVLGSGKRLFREGAPTTTLRLVDTKTTSSGLVILTYEPDRNDPKMTASIPPRAGRRRRVATDTESSRTVSNDLLVHALTDRADAQRRIGNEVDKFKGANHYGIAY